MNEKGKIAIFYSGTLRRKLDNLWWIKWGRNYARTYVSMCQIMYKSILKISEYWTKGNIIGWPDICWPNWPKIFPFVQCSLFFQYSLIHDLALSNLLWIIPYLLNCVFSAFFIARSASQSRSWWIASGRRPNVWVPRCLYWTS